MLITIIRFKVVCFRCSGFSGVISLSIQYSEGMNFNIRKERKSNSEYFITFVFLLFHCMDEMFIVDI